MKLWCNVLKNDYLRLAIDRNTSGEVEDKEACETKLTIENHDAENFQKSGSKSPVVYLKFLILGLGFSLHNYCNLNWLNNQSNKELEIQNAVQLVIPGETEGRTLLSSSFQVELRAKTLSGSLFIQLQKIMYYYCV